jgi:hypothetical protein
MARSDYENLRRRFFRLEDSVKNEGAYNSKMYESNIVYMINMIGMIMLKEMRK